MFINLCYISLFFKRCSFMFEKELENIIYNINTSKYLNT